LGKAASGSSAGSVSGPALWDLYGVIPPEGKKTKTPEEQGVSIYDKRTFHLPRQYLEEFRKSL